MKWLADYNRRVGEIQAHPRSPPLALTEIRGSAKKMEYVFSLLVVEPA
jgi:hypothetical protein